MRTKNEELKPCPFCGGKATTSEKEDVKVPHGWGWVGCQCCKAFMDWSHGESGKRLAIEAWNRRVADERGRE